ncbi:hypothetical protein V6N13_137598 [Hibiscus sabdariffa]|uniref:Uncharacterized protein n=1 Tax=Hibiscus sabdariffa TaxID=183260 RepID=A0ABR2DK56_9ROSI
MPPSLGTTKLEPSHEPHSPTLGLERADQIQEIMNPTQWTEPKSNHPNAPTRVISRRYPTRRAGYAPTSYLKSLKVIRINDVGRWELGLLRFALCCIVAGLDERH